MESTIDDLLARHRKELRDLTSRITQKKKSATKRTRRGINSECEALESELKARHQREILEFENPGSTTSPTTLVPVSISDSEEADAPATVLELPQSEPAAPATNGGGGEGNVKKKPNRAKARLARRAEALASLAAQAEAEALATPDRRAVEMSAMSARLSSLGLLEHPIPPDGHCLYSAFADQLAVNGIPVGEESGEVGRGDGRYKVVRMACAEYIRTHAEDFAPFLEDSIEEHVKKVGETAEWGGHTELLALARAFGVVINVVQAEGKDVEKIGEGCEGEEGRKEVWLGFYRHSFGLGEHYNSLRKQ